MARAAAARGYAATTITDIVREAGVSRRTFYEHFEDKAACMAALLETACGESLDMLRGGLDPALPWHERLERGFTAYFQALAAEPVLLQVLHAEIFGFGRAGLARRRRVDQQIGSILLQVLDGGPGKEARLPPELGPALVGAIHGLVTEYMDSGRVAHLPELGVVVARLARRLATAPGLH